MRDLTKRTALVTRAGTDVGHAIAVELAAQAARLVLVGRDAHRLEATRVEIAASGAEVSAIAADLADTSWLDRVEELATEIDVLVADAPLETATKLRAHLLPGMIRRGFGRIVLLDSLARTNGPRLDGLLRTTALEGAAHGVTCNRIELGLIDCEQMLEGIDPEELERLVSRTPVGRLGRPDEVAAAVAFLASPRAGDITGAVLPVNGGLGLGLYPEQLG